MGKGEFAMNAIQAKASSAAAKSKLASLVALLALAGMFFGLQLLIDHLPWEFQGMGATIWFVFALMFIFAWYTANTYVTTLTKKGNLVSPGSYWRIGGKTPNSVQAWVNEVAERAGISLEEFKLFFSGDQTANAFTAGAGKQKILVLHEGLVRGLNEEGIKGVVAHEMGHMKNNDIFMLVFATSMILSFIFIGRTFFFFARAVLQSGSTRGKKGALGKLTLSALCALVGVVATLIGFLFAPLATAFLSQRREDMADTFAASIGYGDGLTRALVSLRDAPETTPVMEAVAPLYIVQAHSLNAVGNLLGTHPPLESRVKRLTSLIAGDEGLVPDVIENWLRFLVGWIALPTLGAWLLAQHGTALPSLFGVPIVFIATVIWLWGINSMLGTGGVVIHNPGRVLIATAMVVLTGLWLSGCWAITASMAIPGLQTFAQIALGVWLAKPLIFALGLRFGFFSGLQEFSTYASFVYGLFILGKLFEPLIRAL